MQVWGSLSASPMLSSWAQPHCANGPAHTRACGVLYRINKVLVVYTLLEPGLCISRRREGKGRRKGEEDNCHSKVQ